MNEDLLAKAVEHLNEIQRWELARGNRWLLERYYLQTFRQQEYPFYETDSDLDSYRDCARQIAVANGYCKGLLKNLDNAVINSGGKFTVTSDDSGLQKQVESFLEQFVVRNRWHACAITIGEIRESRISEILRRLIRDGEVFLRYFDSSPTILIRFVAPELVRSPQRDDQYNCGIRTEADDSESVLGYYVFRNSNDGSEVSAEDILHIVVPGTDSNQLRGLPELSFDVLDAFTRANQLVKASSIGARERSRIAMIWRHSVGTPEQVASIAAQYRTLQISNLDTTRIDDYSYSADGTTVRVPVGQEPVPLPSDYTSSYLEGVQADLRMCGSAFVSPEYLISGDSSNANFASSKEAGTPWIRQAESLQALIRTISIRVAYEALRRASMPLEGYSLGYELPTPTVRNELDKANEDALLVDRSIKSRTTCQLERGLDPDVERKNIALENANVDQASGGRLPVPSENGRS